MTQAYSRMMANEETVLSFKRHILEKSSRFVSEPMADMYRVNLLGMMLNRYDELRRKGMSDLNSRSRVIFEFDDIDAKMREEGFEEIDMAAQGEQQGTSRLTEAELDAYIREADAALHKRAAGIGLCTACVTPIMVFGALSELILGYDSDLVIMLGALCMFGMICMGVYAIITAGKPKMEKLIRKGQFSLGSRMRRKLTELREAVEQKARRRKGKGIALIIASVMPVLVGAMLEELWFGKAWPLLGVAGMFAMIASGVYELVMGSGEKKTMNRLLDLQ